VSLRYGTRLLALDSRMTIVNTSSQSIDRVRLNTVAARLGALRIGSVSVEGNPVTPSVDDQTITVPFGGILPVGGTVHVRIKTRSTLRSGLTGSSWMYTRANGIIDAYRWLPWVSRSLRFNRPNHGDPFVTPVSPEVRVAITTDRPMRIATSGRKVGSSGLTQVFVARNVRDFTITASPYYRTSSVTVGSKVVRVYYRSGAPASAMLSAARRAISRYASLLDASYPYRTFKVVQSAGGYGMESPGLIWIPTGVSSSNLTYLVFHETAHQWFYGLVGNNQAREPFTDEAAADFIARYALSLRRGSRCSKARLDLSIYHYSSTCYYEVVYIQGGNFLDGMRRDMGSTAFWKGLRSYVAASRWKLVSTKSLLDTLDKATPLNLKPRFERRFPRLY
jgi:aminopeptidase N